MTIALHGNLRDFGIGEVFQLIGQQRKTGVLEVRGQHGEVELRFDAGGVVAAAPLAERRDAPLLDMIARCGLAPRERLAALEAESEESLARRIESLGLLGAEALREIEDLLTRETIFDLLRWNEGSFRFVAQPIEHERSAEHLLGAEQVLMDGLRMVDEWHAFAAELPDEQTVFRRRGSVEEYRSSLAGRPAPVLERIFLLVDGRANVRRVIDLSRLGSFEATRALVQLARAGWIEPVRARRSADPVSGRSGLRSEGRARIAVGAPFALLALLAALAWLRPAPALDPLVLATSSPLASARAELTTRQWRALLHAHRLATGAWASDLGAVAEWAGGAAPALTPSERDAYHVARREEGAVLLAPDR